MPPRKTPKSEAEPAISSDGSTKGNPNESSRHDTNSNLAASSEASPSISAPIDGISQSREATQEAPASSKASIRSKASLKSISEHGGEHGELRRKASGRLWRNGSWNTKAAPVAEVARESIGAISDPKAGRKGSSTSLSSTYLSRSVKGSVKEQKTAANKKPISASPLNLEGQNQGDAINKIDKDELQDSSVPTNDKDNTLVANGAMPISDVDNQRSSCDPSSQAQSTSWGWRGWWTKPDNQIPQLEPQGSKGFTNLLSPENNEISQKASSPGTIAGEGKLNETDNKVNDQTNANDNQSTEVASPTSWFWKWSFQQNMRNPTSAQSATLTNNVEDHPAGSADGIPDKPAKSTPAVNTLEKPKGQKSSGWAFWSIQKPDSKKTGSTRRQVGELAVSDTPSQTKPEVAQFNEQKVDRGRDKSISLESSNPLMNEKKVKSSIAKQSKQVEQSRQGEELNISQRVAESSVQPPASQSHLLLPNFDKTFASAYSPTYWQQLRSWIYGSDIRREHLNLAVAPPKIKSALAIGIHGFFPASIVQRVIGQPTGTSIRFANMGADAIADWTKARGYKCKIEKVALEGEGMIADRVDTLWKLLLNWVDHIRRSDFVFITCHSQGVPVSVMLLSKLLEFGCLSSSVRVGVCAMAGINLGPFGDFKSKLFGATAFELFEFSRQNSAVTKRHVESLERCLRHGVRIVYAASLDDQLVSLEVSILSF